MLQLAPGIVILSASQTPAQGHSLGFYHFRRFSLGHMHNSVQTSSHRDLVPHCSTQAPLSGQDLDIPSASVAEKPAEFQQTRHFSLGITPSPWELECFEGVHWAFSPSWEHSKPKRNTFSRMPTAAGGQAECRSRPGCSAWLFISKPAQDAAKRTEGIMSFPVQRQPLSAERLCCSFKSSQEQSVLCSAPAPRSSRSLSQGVPCSCQGAEPPAAVPMPLGAAKSAQSHKGPMCSREQPLHVAVILSEFTPEPCGLPRLPFSPLCSAVQTNSSSLHSRERIYKKSCNTEEHTALAVHGEHLLERSQVTTEPLK